MKNALSKVGTAVVALLVGAAVGAGALFASQHFGPRGPEGNQQLDVSVVFDRIASENQMVTASQDYNITEKVTDVNTFFDLFDIPFTENSFWYRYVGTIKAGVDLSDAAFAEQGSVIVVSLPKPFVISNTLNMDESGVLEERNNILNPIHLEDIDRFRNQCIDKSEQGAIEGGLLDEAHSNAESNIRSMFKAALGDAYAVEFEWR